MQRKVFRGRGSPAPFQPLQARACPAPFQPSQARACPALVGSVMVAGHLEAGDDRYEVKTEEGRVLGYMGNEVEHAVDGPGHTKGTTQIAKKGRSEGWETLKGRLLYWHSHRTR